MPAIVAALALAAGVTACGKSAQSHYDAAERFAAEGRMPEAILEYRNAVAKQPQFADAQLKLAERLYEVGDQTRALPEFVKAADLLMLLEGVDLHRVNRRPRYARRPA